MARFNLTVVSGPNDIQFAFNEVRDSLAWALSRLGHQVSLSNDWFSELGETNIILGWELIVDFQTVPSNSIVYNLEQPAHPRFPVLKHWAERLTIWDASRDNVSLIPGALHVPLGYTPNLTRIPHTPPSYDAFFAGWMTPRREEALNQLRDLRIFTAGTGCYGGVRDEILSHTRVALNIHHDHRHYFEMARCSYYMANRIPVLTEDSSDMQDYKDLHDGLTVVPLDEFPDHLRSLVSDRHQLKARGEAAFEAIRRRDYVRIMERALDETRSRAPQLVAA